MRPHYSAKWLTTLAIAISSPTLSIQAEALHWLDVVGYPLETRHVQVIDSTYVLAQDGAAEGWTQHAVRLSTDDALALAAALDSWAAGEPLPAPPSIWSHRQDWPGMTYWLDVWTVPGQRCNVQLTALAYVDRGDFCPGCYPAQVFTRQEMLLTRSEARALASALVEWVAGNDPDNLIWSKVIAEP